MFGRRSRRFSGSSNGGRAVLSGLSNLKPRGWSVVEKGRRWTEPGSEGDRYLRHLWGSRRGGLYRIALAALAAYGLYNLLASGHGLLRIQALAREEATLRERRTMLVEQKTQVEDEINEPRSLSDERGLREKYLQRRKNEIVFYAHRAPAGAAGDSSAPGAGGIGWGGDSTVVVGR